MLMSRLLQSHHYSVSLMWFGSWSELWKWRLVFLAILTKPFKTHHIIKSIPELDNNNCSIMTSHSLRHRFYREICMSCYIKRKMSNGTQLFHNWRYFDIIYLKKFQIVSFFCYVFLKLLKSDDNIL